MAAKEKAIFTFQYGSIQIISQANVNNVKLLFTFQYGSIQIERELNFQILLQEFTFQYGSIQIARQERRRDSHFYLHSNMVLFKLGFLKPSQTIRSDLHSNMVLFK